MIPLITSLFNQQVGGAPPVVPPTDIPTTLWLEDTTNSSNRTYTLSPGTAYASRVFIVAFFIYRDFASGSPTYTVTLDGVAMRYETLQTTSRGILHYAVVYDPTSTADRSINIAVTNGSVSSLRIIRLGSPTAHVKSRQYFQQGGYGLVGYSSAVAVDEDSKLLLFAGRGNADALGLISEAGSSVLGTEENAPVEGDGRYVRNAVLTLQPTAGSLTTVSQDASASNTHKGQMGSVLSLKGADELTFLGSPELIYYHMAAHTDAWKDTLNTPCADGDTVRAWGNAGSSVDMQQATAANRPTYRTGGANGYPYLQCDRTTQQFFEDLTDIPQASGSTVGTPYTLAGVVEVTDLSALQPLLGGTAAKGRFVVTTAGAYQVFKAGLTFLTGSVTSGNLFAFCIALTGWSGAGGFHNTTLGSASSSTNASGSVTNVQVLRSTVDAAFFHGKLYELIYWRTALSTNQRIQVSMSLMDKYGMAFAA